MPSQKQLKWSELKVGVTVVVAGLVLAVLIILMSGTGGLFTHKLILRSYFFDAQGLRVGAPVRLSGVDIGNVSQIRVVPNKPLAPVEVAMKVLGDRFTLSIYTIGLAWPSHVRWLSRGMVPGRRNTAF